jgi:hypothetical protein
MCKTSEGRAVVTFLSHSFIAPVGKRTRLELRVADQAILYSCLSVYPLQNKETLKGFGLGPNSTKGIIKLAQRPISGLDGSANGSSICSTVMTFKCQEMHENTKIMCSEETSPLTGYSAVLLVSNPDAAG